jgi:predicted nucleic acid-binding protein
MTAQYFVDTNILLYAGSQDPQDGKKKIAAIDLVKRPGMGISAQVLQEYYEVAYRKRRLGLEHHEVLRTLRLLALKPVVPVTSSLVIEAAQISERYKISYWDSAIIAAAAVLGCKTLYTEDLNHDQSYEGIRVVNPFL